MLSQPMESFPLHDIIFLDQPGPGGGGGGGGNRMKLPAKKAELAAEVRKPEPQPIPEVKPADAPPPPPLDIPAKTSFDATVSVPGRSMGWRRRCPRDPAAVAGPARGLEPALARAPGPAWGPAGAAASAAAPIGPAAGSRTRIVRVEVKPTYTADAMRAKIQGTVILECVVLEDGTVGQVAITKSLDPVFGLDQEAIKAAKQWKFIPGKRQGQPVPVLVSIELTFTLR